MDEWEKRATDIIFGVILHLRTVIQINIISFCLGKRDTGSGLLYPVPMNMGFDQILTKTTSNLNNLNVLYDSPSISFATHNNLLETRAFNL